MARLSLRKIEKQFGSTRVLRGVDIDVPDKSFAVLVGPSGCGKSTLLRVIAGLETCEDGQILFDDDDVTALSPRERDIAMVFQSYALYPHLTVRDNLAFGLSLRKTPKAQVDERIAEVSDMLGLSELLGRFPRELSGGQRQRVAMGRAIVRRPRLFLFDEPLSNLDASLRAQVRVDIRKLHDRLGATSVYVTHDQVEAMTLADQLFVLKGGQVEQAGPPLEVYARPATRFVASFLGSPAMNFLDGEVVQDGGEWLARGTDFELSLDSEQLGGVAAGTPVVVGVRPHDLVLAAEGKRCVQASVDVLEALGTESFVHCRVGGSAVVVRLSGSARPARDTVLKLTAAAKDVHLFEPDSGHALRSAPDRPTP